MTPLYSRRAGAYTFALWSIMLVLFLAAATHTRALRAPASKQARSAKKAQHARRQSGSKLAAAHGTVRYTGPRQPSPLGGKGMWIYQLAKIARGNPARIAHLAKQGHLTHIFVRVGSSTVGLKTLDEAASVIPHAHRHGIKVIAWYFPYFNNVPADIHRSVATIRHRIRGRGFDGFAADIEPAAGSSLSAKTVWDYSLQVRAAAPEAFLIAVPPRPTSTSIAR